MTFKKYVLAAAVMAVMSGSAMADQVANGHITFHGAVNANTCEVTMVGTDVTQNGADFDVGLRSVDKVDVDGLTLNDASSYLEKTPFSMNVKCAAPQSGATEKVSVQFDTFGGSTTNAQGFLFPGANVANIAQDVGYVLLNADDSQIKVNQPGNNTQKQALDANGAAQLDYNVAYVRTGDAVTSGKVIAQVGYTMTYE